MLGLIDSTSTTEPVLSKMTHQIFNADLTTNPDVVQVDWRGKGALNPVKNQKTCGSCWAFASNTVIEARWAIETGNLYHFSEQYTVACSKTGDYGVSGCNGGNAVGAFNFARDQGGLPEEATIPYLNTDYNCPFVD